MGRLQRRGQRPEAGTHLLQALRWGCTTQEVRGWTDLEMDRLPTEARSSRGQALSLSVAGTRC